MRPLHRTVSMPYEDSTIRDMWTVRYERPFLVLALAPAASRTLDAQPLLASVYGGPLAATRDAHGRLLPQTPVYRLDLQPAAGAAAPERRLRGTLVLEVEAEPLLTQVWRRIAAVLIRESGF